MHGRGGLGWFLGTMMVMVVEVMMVVAERHEAIVTRMGGLVK